MDFILSTCCIFLLIARCQHIRAGESCSAKHVDVVSKHVAVVEESVLSAGCELFPASRCPADYEPDSEESYDFIVVGGGTAGSLVANRLSQVDGWKVLVLEAGGCPTSTNEVPSFFMSCQESEWDVYTNQDEDNCLGMNDGRCRWPQGNVLGGGSSVSFNIYMRGHRLDYNRWGDTGCTGWGYDDVLPFFTMHEDMKSEEVLATGNVDKYHGRHGELRIESWKNSQHQQLIDTIKRAALDLEFVENSDCNGDRLSGFVQHQGCMDNGRRCSAEKAFLMPCLNRTNLLIARHAIVQKILIQNGVAYGVEFIKNGSVSRVMATKEVIVTAGAINTAKLLLLSGIGPKDHLGRLGIDCLKDIPVGLNLQDHPMTILGIFTHDSEVPSDSIDNQIYKFLMRKEDCMLSHHGIATNTILWNSERSTDDNPDSQLFMFGFHVEDPKLFEYCSYFNFNKTIIDQITVHNSKKPVILLAVSLLKPFSRGRVELASPDANHRPRIISGYFTDDRDMETVAHAFHLVNKLANTSSMLEINATYHAVNIKQCSDFKDDSKEYIECYVKHMTTTSISPTYSSTCKMGPKDCGDAVSSPNLAVRGFDALRLCDSSIFPSSISGPNTATTLMIAERCARFIKESYNQTG